MIKKKTFWILLAALGVYGILAVNPVVWGDEAYTFALIAHPAGEIWQITAADVHPPLYYLVLKLFTAPFGYSLPVGRVVSAVPCFLILCIAAKKLRAMAGEQTAVLFMLLYLAFPFSMNHAAEARMYSLCQLEVFLCGLYAWSAFESGRGKDFAIMTATALAAAYTHYFALVSVGLIMGIFLLAILLRKRTLWKKWVFCAAVCILGYLPWLGSFLGQLQYKVSNEYWIAPITVHTFLSYAQEMFGAEGLEIYYLFAAVMFAGAFLGLLLRGGRKTIALLALAVPLGTAGLGLLVSILIRPIFIIRYLLPCVPLLIFFLAWSLTEVGLERFTAGVLAVSLMAGSSNFLYRGKQAVSPGSYNLMGDFVEATRDAEAYVVYNGEDGLTSQVLAYYDGSRNVYSNAVLASGNPFSNWLDAGDFQEEAFRYFVLFLEEGTQMPERFRDFTGTKKQTFNVFGTEMTAWEMRK